MALCWGRPRAPHEGRLRDSLLVAFEGLRTTVPSVATVLSGPVQDQALALRCRIVLACAEGHSNQAVADRLGVSKPTVTKWRSRSWPAGWRA
jgi:FixJ family two-component response regulator